MEGLKEAVRVGIASMTRTSTPLLTVLTQATDRGVRSDKSRRSTICGPCSVEMGHYESKGLALIGEPGGGELRLNIGTPRRDLFGLGLNRTSRLTIGTTILGLH